MNIVHTFDPQLTPQLCEPDAIGNCSGHAMIFWQQKTGDSSWTNCEVSMLLSLKLKTEVLYMMIKQK